VYDVPGLIRAPSLFGPLATAVAGDHAPPFLRSAKLKLTARCNLRCSMCRFGRGWAPPELPAERFAEILEELAALGCRKVHFSGGEVMVRPELERLVASSARLGMKTTLTSNLTLLTKPRAKALMAAKPSSVSTSLDAANAKLHDRIRGVKGSFKRTLKALERLSNERERVGRRTRLRVNFTLMRSNFREYPELVALCAGLGVTEVHPMPVDDDDPSSPFRLSVADVREYEAEVAPQVLEARARAGMSLDARAIHPFGVTREEHVESVAGRYAGGFYRHHLCYSPWLHLFVAWDGKVFLCCMTDGKIDALGDLAAQSVAEVFHGEKLREVRQRMKRQRLDECHRCDMVLAENRLLGSSLRLPLVPAESKADASSA